MQAVLDYLAANDARFVNELIQHASFPSVSAQPHHAADVAACADWLLQRARAIGLNARLVKTPGNPVLVATTRRGKKSAKPHYLVYGHYDVQPPEPFELWKSEPFKPTVRGRSLFGRGTSDNKGQHLAHLNAVEAYLKTGTELPCDLTFVIEGEEEVGSGHLAAFLEAHRNELACDAVVISDTGIPDLKHPALTYSLRGIAALEIKLTGPDRDLHSGIYGGSVENPAMALCQLLAKLRDAKGRIAIPGFYDDVQPLSKLEREQARRFPLSNAAYRKMLGVKQLFGEAGFSAQEQRTARPTLEINGLTSGYQGVGSKTIVPSWASAKLTMRLVPNQKPEKILRLVKKHLTKLCPKAVKLEITDGHAGAPYFVSPTGPHAQAALRALRKSFGHEPILMREGGSIPIVNDFKRILGADTLLLGLALPDDNAHSPNEKFSLDAFTAGMKMSALLWPELASC
jgi:acetylornithine deacetylase/succinyl-diaminopimelate desuccinylase-like protein